VGQVEHRARTARLGGQVGQGLKKRSAQVGQPSIVAGDRRPRQHAGRRVDRLKEPDPTFEQARQVIEVLRATHQGIEPLNADQAPAEALRVIEAARQVLGTDQQPARKFRLDPREQLAECSQGSAWLAQSSAFR